MTDRELLNEARLARTYAYTPYSRFPVGAALLCADGTVYQGCNMENISFGLTICAERIAIAKAVSEGKREFTALAVAADTDDMCMPCGACRQVMAEFGIPKIITGHMKTERMEVYTLSELLPHSFHSLT